MHGFLASPRRRRRLGRARPARSSRSRRRSASCSGTPARPSPLRGGGAHAGAARRRRPSRRQPFRGHARDPAPGRHDGRALRRHRRRPPQPRRGVGARVAGDARGGHAARLATRASCRCCRIRRRRSGTSTGASPTPRGGTVGVDVMLLPKAGSGERTIVYSVELTRSGRRRGPAVARRLLDPGRDARRADATAGGQPAGRAERRARGRPRPQPQLAFDDARLSTWWFLVPGFFLALLVLTPLVLVPRSAPRGAGARTASTATGARARPCTR